MSAIALLRRVPRHPRWTVVIIALTISLLALVAVWFQPQQAFVNHTVDEPLPMAAAVASPTVATTVPAAPAAAVVVAAPAPTSAPTGPVTLAQGTFRSLEHPTSGAATVLRLDDGSLVLRLENLDTSSGPDVHITLSPTPSTAADHDYSDLLELGPLKGNHGNQNYPIAAGTDLSHYRSVVIWCRRFSVGFGVAGIG